MFHSKSPKTEIPCSPIESQMRKKVAGDRREYRYEFRGSAGRSGIVLWPLPKGGLCRTDVGSSLTAELELFEPLDSFALVGDNLRLPDKGDGHEAHGDNTNNENQSDVGLLSGKTKDAS